ncbi:MAG: hypothetical protein LC117_00385 [Bacteroidia bacterium]|nr:hypothetical protein [Bacteroidia bacterium]MCZ2276373.1 hypothetical protein [Bacteroidia bacterium]
MTIKLLIMPFRLILLNLFFYLFLILHTGFAQVDTIPGADQPVTVQEIIITGNDLTKTSIVKREIIIHQGDVLPFFALARAVERSRENLMNTSLFNFVTTSIQTDANDSSRVFVIFNLLERWYLWPLPVFEAVDRNFNEWWLRKDFSRTNYGAYITHENFRGRKERLSILIRLGYSQRLGLYYTVPYLNHSKNNGLAFGISYTRNHEIGYGLQGSKVQFFKDPESYVRKQLGAGIKYTHRQGINQYYGAGVEFQNSHIADTILTLNNNYFLRNLNTQKIFFLTFEYKDDHRDIKVYPLKGYYFDVVFTKQGIGVFDNEPDLISLTSNYRKYWKLSRLWHAAAGVKGKLSGKSFTPYYNQRGLGYGNDFVRGYEYYAITGTDFLLFKTNLKFSLVPERVFKLGFLPSKKFNLIPYAFYLNLFSDLGYVHDKQFQQLNPLANQWLSGNGIGLDYVTYYDMVLRVEYSYNKFGEHGFFIHFTAPIF